MASASLASFVPDHVPPELVWDNSLEAFNSELDDPFLAASRLLDGPPVFWARDGAHGRPGWVIARHALLQEAFVDYEHFSSEGGMDLTQLLGVDWNLNPVNIDPPRHTAYRKVLTPFFTPRAINHMEPAVRETCDRLIAKFEDRGTCEFIEEFATPLPTYIFLALMGMPIEMAPQFLAWEAGLLRSESLEERVGAGRAVLDYLQGFLREQRAKPTTPLMEGIMGARLDGRPLDDGEVLGMFYTFFVGGLDTVYSTLGWSMRYLALRPELQRQLRANPDLLPRATDELLRLFGVVSSQRRVKKDFNSHGVEMRENELVIMPIFIACRDPEAYSNPHEAVLDRKAGLLSFASGPHTCLGMYLARREIRIAIESFLRRFEHIHIPDGESYSYHAGVVFGVDRLPLAWNQMT